MARAGCTCQDVGVYFGSARKLRPKCNRVSWHICRQAMGPVIHLTSMVRWEAETKESLNTLMPAGLDTLVMRVCLKK